MAASAVPGFFSKPREERLRIVADFAGLSEDELGVLRAADGGVPYSRADQMVENAIGTFSLPLGVATNFRINGADRMVPMAIEEPSVIAAASKGAKAARGAGGFEAEASESYSVGQIQVVDADMESAAGNIRDHAPEILGAANAKSATLSGMGRGAKEVSCREVDAPSGRMLVVEILVDVGDAMGANITNTMCEAVSPLVGELAGGRPLLRILSNYSTRRTASARAVFGRDAVGGDAVVSDMIRAFEFADNDVYRAVTHNKGIMNGIVAVANATGQDGRAIEAAAHAYASETGRYRSLTRWEADAQGNLVGTLRIPLAVGTVGGVAGVHPVARVCMRMLGATSARQLACAMASAGLAQNYGAMRALVTEGIQKGHMRLHARNLAAAAGAAPGQVDEIAAGMVAGGDISLGAARRLLGQT